MSTKHNLFEEKGESKRNRAVALLFTNLTPYRQAKAAYTVVAANVIIVTPKNEFLFQRNRTNLLAIVQPYNTDDKLTGSEAIKVLSTTVSLL